jgi:hypothetical protein
MIYRVKKEYFFDEGHTPRSTEEVLKVSHIQYTDLVIMDEIDEEIQRTFCEQD